MDQAIAEKLIEYGGLFGMVVVALWILRPVFLKALDNMHVAENNRTQLHTRELDQERALTQTLDGLSNTLTTMQQVVGNLSHLIGGLPSRGDFEQIKGTMQAWAAQHDQALGGVKTQLANIESELQAVPGRVLADSQLETLCNTLREHVQSMENRLIQAAGPYADQLLVGVRTEFESISARLSEIQTALHELNGFTKGANGDPTPDPTNG